MTIKTPPRRPCGFQMHRIDDAVEISRLGRSTLYTYIKSGRLKSVRIGGRRLIPDSALRELLQIEELR